MRSHHERRRRIIWRNPSQKLCSRGSTQLCTSDTDCHIVIVLKTSRDPICTQHATSATTTMLRAARQVGRSTNKSLHAPEKENQREERTVFEQVALVHAVQHAVQRPSVFVVGDSPSVVALPSCVVQRLEWYSGVSDKVTTLKSSSRLSSAQPRGFVGPEMLQQTANSTIVNDTCQNPPG